MNFTADIEFITPLFSRGMTEEPEIRPASIRGQLHWWFRALGGTWEEECAVFGKIGGKKEETFSSPLVVRVSDIQGKTGERPTLPHKEGEGRGRDAPKPCYLPGTRCKVHFFLRRLLPDDSKARLHRCIETWLLVGSLGLRSTRGAGAFVWLNHKDTSQAAYFRNIADLTKNARVKIAHLPHFSDEPNPTPEDLRWYASDTIGGRDDRRGETDLYRINHPLGALKPKRKTSPLRFRPIATDEGYVLLAIWDQRQEVTGNSDKHLQSLIALLENKKKDIGLLLRSSTLVS